MKNFRIQRYQTTVTLAENVDTENAPVVGQLNGVLKGITISAPDITGTSYTITILGQRGETLFSKASLTDNGLTYIGVDANNHPLSIPLSLLGVSPLKIKSVATGDATGALTMVADTSDVADGDTVTIAGPTDSRVYRFKTTTAAINDVKIIPDVKATAVLTSDATAPDDGDTVTIGATTYTFKTALTAPETANEVLIGASAATALDNLKSAVNLSAGGGTTYGSDTVINASATATTNTDTEQTFEAKVGGTGGNAIAKAEVSNHLDFDGAGAFFTGGTDQGFETLENLKLAIMATGAGDGSDYHAGTAAHGDVTATRTNGVLTVTAKETVEAASDVATTENSSVLSWGAATLTGGGELAERVFNVDLLVDRG